jgi:hypothetical protein
MLGSSLIKGGDNPGSAWTASDVSKIMNEKVVSIIRF